MRYRALCARLVAGVLIVTSGMSAAAELKSPVISTVRPDWNAAMADAKTAASDLAELNSISAERFADIKASPVPVLLPFDAAGYLRDRSAGNGKPPTDYLAGFAPTGFFLAGPAGYDAAFSVRTGATAGLSDISFAEPVLVTVSGFAFVYELPPPAGAIERAGREFEAEFPGIRRQIIESTLRYSFERYGVPYVVSIQCYDGAQRRKRLSCKNAERVGLRFLRELRLAGGTPAPVPEAIAAPPIERPQRMSDVFTYHPVGRLLPGTGMRGRGGDADPTVYANIRFPLADAPAYVNSQSFMHGGDCDRTGRRPVRGREDASYRCRVNTKPLARNEGAAENYSYPWRDNFCEHRFFFVGQCSSGLGHQGQDIRPAFCKRRNAGAGGCQTNQYDVVAVRAGMILREPWHESFFLVVNTANERLRFRYLHMHPRRMDEDKLVSGRAVREGERIGKVGNFNRREGASTTHLHFEVQVPTRDGWLRVNPYMTLVTSYERLIRARGLEITEPDPQPETTQTQEAASAKASAVQTKGQRKFRSRKSNR